MRKTPCVKIKRVQSRVFHLLQLDKVENEWIPTRAAFFVEMGTNLFATGVHCARLCRLLPLRLPASCPP